MRIVVGNFYQESTTFNPFVMDKDAFTFVEGEEVKERISVTNYFEEQGIEVIPTIYANATSAGCVAEEAYRFFADKIINVLKNEKDIDGIWLHLHGAMEVVNVGAGEAALLREIREVVGDDIPISLTLDLHANIDDDVPKLANIICSYRTAPHVDQEETERITAELLVDCIKRNAKIKPAFRRIYMITPGEKSTDNTQPMRSILDKFAEYEKKEGILLANYINGHAWTDRPNTSACAIIIPESEEYQELAEKIADELAEFAFNLRHEFKLTQFHLEPEETIDIALRQNMRPIFITDSGDNTTGGAAGINTMLLQILMNKNIGNKKVAVAGILDRDACKKLSEYEVGEEVIIDVGIGYDKDSAPVRLEGVLKVKGDLLGFLSSKNDVVGNANTVSVGNIDVVITNQGDSFTTLNHFTAAGLNIDDYDIIIVKQGYLFTELSTVSKFHIMAMTAGACNLRVEDLEFKNLIRPMYPLDK
ncbi:MAG: M81 family metallopeptidase [Tissierella sp.]|nr:M81 family metallopeptidase [Tissierella sp.]